MGTSMTAALLAIPVFARGAKGVVVPAVTAVGLFAWLAVAVATASTAASHIAVAPAITLALCTLWLGVAPLRRAWDGASMVGLVALQVLRFSGGARMFAVEGGWLPERYGMIFGAADVVLAVVAVALAWAWSHGATWARRTTLGWAMSGVILTVLGLVVQARLVRPLPGFEGLWSAFLTPLLLALLVVTASRARVARAAA